MRIPTLQRSLSGLETRSADLEGHVDAALQQQIDGLAARRDALVQGGVSALDEAMQSLVGLGRQARREERMAWFSAVAASGESIEQGVGDGLREMCAGTHAKLDAITQATGYLKAMSDATVEALNREIMAYNQQRDSARKVADIAIDQGAEVEEACADAELELLYAERDAQDQAFVHRSMAADQTYLDLLQKEVFDEEMRRREAARQQADVSAARRLQAAKEAHAANMAAERQRHGQ